MRIVSQSLPFLALSIAVFGTAGSAHAGQGTKHQDPGLNKTVSGERLLTSPLGIHSIVPAYRRVQDTALCLRSFDPTRAGCFAAANIRATVLGAFPYSVNGLTPNDISSLYAYPKPQWQGTMGMGQTVAIVVAHDYASAESDLAVYRKYYGLPPCSSAGGCLTKVGAAATGQSGQTGTGTSVSANPTTPNAIGWAAETDVDTEMVSAVCPNCRITIAEAATDSMSDLTKAVATAIASGATIVNTSFGAPESAADLAFAPTYNSPNVKIVSAAGDWGYGVYFPAADTNVIAVGGTSIQVLGSLVSETVWSRTGSGCSQYFAKPSWQKDPGPAWLTCKNRTVADVAAIADPNTGVAMYDSSLFGAAGGGWTIVGGTSVSAPIVSGMYALSGQVGPGLGAQILYALHFLSFLSITSGSNGTCYPTYLCTGGIGYNGPTGNGVPQGLSGF